MKIIATLVLGLIGLAVVLGGLGAVAEETYPAAVPVHATVSTGATAGDPTFLIVCVAVVVIGFALGNRGH